MEIVMQARIVATIAAFAALAVAGCATTPGPQAQASTESRECKVTTVYSASEELRNQNKTGVTGSDIQRAEGANEIGRVAGFPPPELRNSISKQESLAGKAQKDC
jgi:hypothetical protein